jgi:nickel transport protein
MRSVIAAVLLLVAAVGTAHAHAIKVFAYVEDDHVVGSVYFPGGGRAVGVPVRLVDAAGRELAAATTDAEGGFTLDLPAQPGNYTVVTQSIDGHRAECPLRVGGGSAPAPAAPADAPTREALPPAVATRLDALYRRLEEYETRVRLHDILGGIGYIVGVAGIYLYAVSRRRSDSPT